MDKYPFVVVKSSKFQTGCPRHLEPIRQRREQAKKEKKKSSRTAQKIPCRIGGSCICGFTEGDFIQVLSSSLLQLGTMNDFNRTCVLALARCTRIYRIRFFFFFLRGGKKNVRTCPRRRLENKKTNKKADPHVIQGSIPPLSCTLSFPMFFFFRSSNPISLISITYGEGSAFGCLGQSLDHRVWRTGCGTKPGPASECLWKRLVTGYMTLYRMHANLVECSTIQSR